MLTKKALNFIQVFKFFTFAASIFLDMNVDCPVSGERVNESVVRLVAFFVLVILGTSFVLNSVMGALFLAFDFCVRSFTDGKYSPLKNISMKVAELCKMPVKPVDAAPKKFAAGVGMFFSILLGIAFQYELDMMAYVVASIFGICAFLESVFAYCLGCKVYSLLKLAKLISE